VEPTAPVDIAAPTFAAAASHSASSLTSLLACPGGVDLSEIAVDVEITARHGCGDPLAVISSASLARRRELLQRSLPRWPA
jgi:hypothetical protein